MRRPNQALARAFLGTALAASTASAQQPALPPGVGPAADPSAPASAVNPARGARHLLRNGWDYVNYQEYERALAFFREAEQRKAELTEPERVRLKQGLERAQRGLREAAGGINSGPAYARSGRNTRPGSIALAAPAQRDAVQLASASTPDGPPNARNVRASGDSSAGAPSPFQGLPSAPAAIPATPDVEPTPAQTPALVPAVEAGPALPPAALPEFKPAAPAPVAAPAPTPALPPSAAPVASPADLAGMPTLPPNLGEATETPVPSPSARQTPAPAPAPAALPEPDLPALPADLPPEPLQGPGPVPVPAPPQAAAPDPVPVPAQSLPGMPAADPAAELPPMPAPDPLPDGRPAAAAELPPAAEPSAPAVPRVAQALGRDTPPEPAPVPAADAPVSAPTPEPPPAPPADSFLPERTASGPSTLSPELQREVQRIAQRQDEEMRQRERAGASPAGGPDQGGTAGPGSPNSTRLEISRAPSPTEARPIRAIPVPEEFVPLPKREWAPNRKYWSAAAVCHLPLYFQDATLERYGYGMEQRFGTAGRYLTYPIDDPRQSKQRNQLIQPIFSAGLFAAQIALLPYNLIMDPPWEAEYDLGYYRPGDRVPPDVYYLPLTGVGPPLHGKNYGVAPSASRW